MRRSPAGTLVAVVSLAAAGWVGAGAPLPEGPGLASKYPGDRGIERDPDVVFAEHFDGSVDDVVGRWEDAKNREIFSLSDDAPAGRSLLMTHVGGKGTGGHLYRRLMPGHERLFARFYVKFDPDCAEVHHFGTNIGGNHPATRWPMVRAGEPPAGDRSFWVGAEPFGKRWVWDYYTYWVDMRGSPPRGQTWGNSFIRNDALAVAKGRWICIELMVKLNRVGDTDGELAMWIDGRRVSHLGKGFPTGTWTFDKFEPGRDGEGTVWDRAQGGRRQIPGGKPFEGFRWRTAEGLKINYVWAYLYMTGAPAGHTSRVWFDQIVVAKRYVGPIVAAKRGGR